jgi:DNA-binding response OmpR family regulator
VVNDSRSMSREPRTQVSSAAGREQTRDSHPTHLRIATIDRDADFLRALARHVGQFSWSLIAHPGPVSGTALLGGNPHAVLIDVALLGPRWDAWLAHQAAEAPQLGLLICAETSTMRQRVRALRAGADDWITKPCDVEEVAARLLAIVRARQFAPPDEQGARSALGSAQLEVRPDLFDAFAAGVPAGLTRREFDVLLCLARNRGKVLDRRQIYLEVWGFTMVHGDRSVDTFVRKIRVKLELISPHWRYIHTHKGVGYRFAGELLKRARRP